MVAVSALAQETKIYQEGNYWVEETRGTINSPKSVKIVTDFGAVRFQGTGSQDVTYVVHKRIAAGSEEQAKRAFAEFGVAAGSNGELAWVKGICKSTSRRTRVSVDFNVQGPKSLNNLVTHTGGGPIDVAGVGGQLDSETGGGPIRVDDVGGTVRAASGGGPIEIGTVGGDLRIETGGGDIRVRQVNGHVSAESGGGNISVERSNQGVEVQTGGGAITVNKSGGDVHADSGGGDLDIGDSGGATVAETGGGEIRVNSSKGPVRAETGGGNIVVHGIMRGVRAETGAGGIEVEFVSLPGGFESSQLETSVGNVRVLVPPALPMTIKAQVEVGHGQSIQTDFPEIRISSEPGYGPTETYAQGNINGGGPVLKIEATSGNISIRKK